MEPPILKKFRLQFKLEQIISQIIDPEVIQHVKDFAREEKDIPELEDYLFDSISNQTIPSNHILNAVAINSIIKEGPCHVLIGFIIILNIEKWELKIKQCNSLSNELTDIIKKTLHQFENPDSIFDVYIDKLVEHGHVRPDDPYTTMWLDFLTILFRIEPKLWSEHYGRFLYYASSNVEVVQTLRTVGAIGQNDMTMRKYFGWFCGRSRNQSVANFMPCCNAALLSLQTLCETPVDLYNNGESLKTMCMAMHEISYACASNQTFVLDAIDLNRAMWVLLYVVRFATKLQGLVGSSTAHNILGTLHILLASGGGDDFDKTQIARCIVRIYPSEVMHDADCIDLSIYVLANTAMQTKKNSDMIAFAMAFLHNTNWSSFEILFKLGLRHENKYVRNVSRRLLGLPSVSRCIVRMLWTSMRFIFDNKNTEIATNRFKNVENASRCLIELFKEKKINNPWLLHSCLQTDDKRNLRNGLELLIRYADRKSMKNKYLKRFSKFVNKVQGPVALPKDAHYVVHVRIISGVVGDLMVDAVCNDQVPKRKPELLCAMGCWNLNCKKMARAEHMIKTQACAGCMLARYCSKSCQDANRHLHREQCHRWARFNVSSGSSQTVSS